MASKNDIRVTIGGRTYTLSGYESEAYLKEVAAYLNEKIAEIRDDKSLNDLPFEMRNILLQLNIADDYFKARDEVAMLRRQAAETEAYYSDMKHDLVAAQMKLETAQKKLRELTDR